MKTRDLNAALKLFRDKGGTLRTRDLIALGVHTDSLYALREKGQIVELGRGLYRVADALEAEYPDLAVVAARAPNAAVCLISALSYHGITTQIPSSIHLAVPRGTYKRIRLSIPITVYQFNTKTFTEGLESHRIGGMPVKSIASRAQSLTASSSGTNSGWTSPLRRCVLRDNESACRTVHSCATPGCCASKHPCHRTCRPSNDRSTKEHVS
jgi:predicted transcriptional regulator of viral defense system